MAAEVTSAPEKKEAPGLWLYGLLVAIQTAAAGLIIWNGLPIYRQLVADPTKHVPQRSTLVWSAGTVALIQVAFWLCRRLYPKLPQGGHFLISQVVLFLGRLCFVIATSTFSVVFVLRPHQLTLPPLRVALLLAVLFSVFCYTQELDRLGRALQGSER